MTILFCTFDQYLASNIPSKLFYRIIYECACGQSVAFSFYCDNIIIVLCDSCHDSSPNHKKILSIIQDYLPKTMDKLNQSKKDNFNTNH